MAHGLSCSAACGIFPDQGLNLCPLHWQEDYEPLRHQGSPTVTVLLHSRRGLEVRSSSRLQLGGFAPVPGCLGPAGRCQCWSRRLAHPGGAEGWTPRWHLPVACPRGLGFSRRWPGSERESPTVKAQGAGFQQRAGWPLNRERSPLFHPLLEEPSTSFKEVTETPALSRQRVSGFGDTFYSCHPESLRPL